MTLLQHPTDVVDVTITLPVVVELRPETETYRSRHIDVHLSTPAQQAAIRRLYDALDRRNDRLATNQPVVSSADVIRFVMERVEEAVGQLDQQPARRGRPRKQPGDQSGNSRPTPPL